MKHISDRLARLVCSTYAIESMSYLTTGLLDEFQDQDVELEAAILKVIFHSSKYLDLQLYFMVTALRLGEPLERSN